MPFSRKQIIETNKGRGHDRRLIILWTIVRDYDFRYTLFRHHALCKPYNCLSSGLSTMYFLDDGKLRVIIKQIPCE